jgi:hypothetical protein
VMLCCLYRPSAPFPVYFPLYLATGRLPLQYSSVSLEAESRIFRQAMTSTRHRPEPRQEISMGRGRISQRIPRHSSHRLAFIYVDASCSLSLSISHHLHSTTYVPSCIT